MLRQPFPVLGPLLVIGVLGQPRGVRHRVERGARMVLLLLEGVQMQYCVALW